jgi:hypothetical protein
LRLRSHKRSKVFLHRIEEQEYDSERLGVDNLPARANASGIHRFNIPKYEPEIITFALLWLGTQQL